MAAVVISEVLCFTCQNYRKIDKTTLLDTIAKFYHDDELYAAKIELNNYVSSLSAPPLVDGWSKFVNKQGLPIVRKSSDAAMKRCADAEDLLQMLAILDVQQIKLPTFVAADLDRIPGTAGCSRPPDAMLQPDTSKLNATVGELLRRFEVLEKRLQGPYLPHAVSTPSTPIAVTAEPSLPAVLTAADGCYHGVAAKASAPSTDSAVQGSWAAQASQLSSTGMQPRKTLPVRVRGKSTHATVKAVPRYLTCFVGRISPDVTEEDLAEMLEEKGIVGVRCKKIEPKNGLTYSTAAFRVSCSVSYESIFYDESSWPEGAELRDWYFGNSNGRQ